MKEMATQPTILAREIPWTEERSGLVLGSQSPTDLVTKQQSNSTKFKIQKSEHHCLMKFGRELRKVCVFKSKVTPP